MRMFIKDDVQQGLFSKIHKQEVPSIFLPNLFGAHKKDNVKQSFPNIGWFIGDNNKNDVQRGWFSSRMIFKGEMNKKLLPPCWLTHCCRCLLLTTFTCWRFCNWLLPNPTNFPLKRFRSVQNLIFNMARAAWFSKLRNGGISKKTQKFGAFREDCICIFKGTWNMDNLRMLYFG